MKEYIQVFATVPTKKDAERMAQTLVRKRLAGCVQIVGPISSIYWWKNMIETAQEWLCLVKSEKRLYERIEKTIKHIHSYEIPEITSVSIVAGSKEYLEWIDQETRTSGLKNRISTNP